MYATSDALLQTYALKLHAPFRALYFTGMTCLHQRLHAKLPQCTLSDPPFFWAFASRMI